MTGPMPYTLAEATKDCSGDFAHYIGDLDGGRVRDSLEALDAAKKRIAELEAELRKRPWVDGEDIVQGEHEADTGTIGYTHAGVDRLLTKARTEKQWVITRITEELKREGIELRWTDGGGSACPSGWHRNPYINSGLKARAEKAEQALATVTMERDEARADFASVVSELECEPTREDAVAEILRDVSRLKLDADGHCDTCGLRPEEDEKHECPPGFTQSDELTSLRAEVERLRAKGEALAKATKRVTHEWSMDANVRVIGAAVIDARAALAEWEKP